MILASAAEESVREVLVEVVTAEAGGGFGEFDCCSAARGAMRKAPGTNCVPTVAVVVMVASAEAWMGRSDQSSFHWLTAQFWNS